MNLLYNKTQIFLKITLSNNRKQIKGNGSCVFFSRDIIGCIAPVSPITRRHKAVTQNSGRKAAIL